MTDEAKKIAPRADMIVHWTTGPVYCCVPHANALLNIGADAVLTALREAGALVEWRPMSEQPEPMHRPSRQFIVVEGWSDHSGAHWVRKHWGLAHTRTGEDSIQGYRKEDMMALAKDGDMELYSMSVTHWMPAYCPSGSFPPAPGAAK